MHQFHQPLQKSLAFRAQLARLVSPLRRVRPRVPFFKLAAHRIPTLWSLYRGLLSEAPSEEIKSRIKVLFRRNQHLTGTHGTKRGLLKGYKFLDTFKKANAGDEKQKAILKRYSRALEAKAEKEHMKYLALNEYAWQVKLRNRPIMTGGFLRPSLFNGPLPRLKPQPLSITNMIRKRRIARERQVTKLADIQEALLDLKMEAEFEAGVVKLAGRASNHDGFYMSQLNEWTEPIKVHQRLIYHHLRRYYARRNTPYPPELLKAIIDARREKIANKTRELERERRGEVLRRTILRQNKGPPAHILAVMTPEQRKMDEVARSVSEVGYVAQVKRKLGHKLKNPDAWKVEDGAPEHKEKYDLMTKEIRMESKRRDREARERNIE